MSRPVHIREVFTSAGHRADAVETARNLTRQAETAVGLALIAQVRHIAALHLRDTAPGVSAFYVDLDRLAAVIRERGPLAALTCYTPTHRR